MIYKYLIAIILNFSGAVTCRKAVPKLPEYCADFEASIRDFKMDAFVATINEQYKEQHADSPPKTQQNCQDTLNELLTDCDVTTVLQEKMKRSLIPQSTSGSGAPSNKTSTRSDSTYEEAGTIDIRTVNHTDESLAPLVVKLRHNKKACTPLSGLVKFLDLAMFNDLYPKQKIILLALGFSRTGEPAVREWISLFYQNGKIVGAQQNADCLNSPEFSDLKYNGKHLKEYFKKA